MPLLAARAYDSDLLRESLRREGYRLVARHRADRTRPVGVAHRNTLRKLTNSQRL